MLLFRGIRLKRIFIFLCFHMLISPIGEAQPMPPEVRAGILVMAHGGSPAWNAAAIESVNPLGTILPVRIAFGMAQPEPLQKAIHELETEGVTHIAVVGLFVSPKSFREQIEYLLGLRPKPPPVYLHHPAHKDMRMMSHHDIEMIPGAMAPSPIQKTAKVLLNQEGLYDSREIGQIIVERVASLSTSPEMESVLILAHGEGDNTLNDQWFSHVDDLATQVRQFGPFKNVQVETLREDWENERAHAEKRIRNYVQKESDGGNNVLVIPFRLFGFGPYATVLKGLEYLSNGHALLPHPIITDWIREQAQICFERMGIYDSIKTATGAASNPIP